MAARCRPLVRRPLRRRRPLQPLQQEYTRWRAFRNAAYATMNRPRCGAARAHCPTAPTVPAAFTNLPSRLATPSCGYNSSNSSSNQASRHPRWTWAACQLERCPRSAAAVAAAARRPSLRVHCCVPSASHPHLHSCPCTDDHLPSVYLICYCARHCCSLHPRVSCPRNPVRLWLAVVRAARPSRHWG